MYEGNDCYNKKASEQKVRSLVTCDITKRVDLDIGYHVCVQTKALFELIVFDVILLSSVFSFTSIS